MSVLFLAITDGRKDCIAKSVPSALQNLAGPVTRRVIYDDSGDDEYAGWLDERFTPRGFEVVHGDRRGFGGAIAYCWSEIVPAGPERYVWHHEDDFLYNRPVPLVGMMNVLDQRSPLVQLVLRRQPWNADERAAGGIVEQHPDDFVEYEDCLGRHWLEHRRFWSTNPSLYHASLCERGWPVVEHSEGVFTHQLLEDPVTRFGFWGARDSGEWVEHIGHQRVGTGY